MKNKKWGTTSYTDEDLYVVLFCSRNKDNKHIVDFKERRKSFVTTKDVNDPSLINEFEHFVNSGSDGEVCRMYYSVNARDKQTVYKVLLHFLIDEPDFNLCSINSKIAGIAATKECQKQKRWMFDFDIDDEVKVKEFCDDIVAVDADVIPKVHKTPHGYAVITSRGFDTREFCKKWAIPDVTLKKDDLLCVRWETTKKEDM